MSARKPLKVGDRVKVWDGPLRLLGAKGTIENVCGHNDLYYVKLDAPTPEADTPLIHARQCVRLRRRERSEKRGMKVFTMKDLRAFGPCYDPVKYLPENWTGTALDILDCKAAPFEDRLWMLMRTDFVSEKLMRLFAVWCARQVQHLMKDERSLKALDVAEAFANGRATQAELDVARAAARAAARDAAWAAAWAAARDAARDAAWDAARDAAWAAAWDAARDAAWAAAWDVARAAQEKKLREMLLAGVSTGDVVMEAE